MSREKTRAIFHDLNQVVEVAEEFMDFASEPIGPETLH